MSDSRDDPQSREEQDARELDRTLLVCADRSVLAPGEALLLEAGFRIVRAEGWAEALSCFEELRPTAVLIDGAFLDGSGPRLCAALRRMSGRVEVPILALCAGKRDVQRALEAGATDVVAERPLDWYVVSRRLLRLHQERATRLESVRLRRMLQEARRSELQVQEQVTRQTLLDPLTGLPSRLALYQALQRALARTRDPGLGVALVTLDLDGFSDLNETLGREAGDDILREVGGRLRAGLRRPRVAPGKTPGLMLVARVGGNEFAVMATGPVDSETVSSLTLGLLDEVARPLTVSATEIHPRASAGIAVAHGALAEAGELLQHAETAMYEAKKRGGGQVLVYSEFLRSAAGQKLGMDRRLRTAFEGGKLALHYQPVVESATRRILAAEALLRWEDGENGFVSPSEFVPVAEETGFMVPIGSWVLTEACRQLRSWIDGGLPPIRMAVNVSRCQLERGDFAAEVERVLSATGLEPGLLELELSERGTLRSDPSILSQLRKLRALGVRIVVDDFGTGQSAIAYLRHLPLDGLKIDRSFVGGVESDGDDSVIVSAIAAMGSQLGLDVVVEGVETRGQLSAVTRLGCAQVQGFFYSRAKPPEEFMESVEMHGVRPATLRPRGSSGHEVPS